MIIKNLQVIGFDLDNTLYDQSQFMFSFFHKAALDLSQRLGMPAADIEESFVNVWKFRTSYYPYLFDESLEKIGVNDPNILKALVASFRSHRTSLLLFEGAREMLGFLKERYMLFMITDGHKRTQENKIESLQIREYFSEIIITGEHGKDWTKPSPLAYACVMKRLGGDAKNYLYIGDNPHCDFFGAKSIGMMTVRVATGPFANTLIDDKHYNADLVINDIVELRNILS